MKQRETKLKMLAAILMTLITLFYFLATIPGLREVQPVHSVRRGFQTLGWKTQWSMFAPGPRREYPVVLTARFYSNVSSHQFSEQKIFDFYSLREHGFFKGVDQTLWALFYIRLWGETDCRTNCENFLDALVTKRKSISGEKILRAELVWQEGRIPNINEGILTLQDMRRLPPTEVIGFSKTYEP
ncbi:hypothetical protein AZI86_16215 [Bdellovibrio bacteriovorus]|uniref:Uncharacterized protein n=1 Tax=Bdellovibrio bacteriovorus TaxID=959 RepID=A0A150WH13_BDEBC|nr:hypothetical protein AZI86_16215 [Bdellovibrio bacteriovorus]